MSCGNRVSHAVYALFVSLKLKTWKKYTHTENLFFDRNFFFFFTFQTNERHASFDDTDYNNRQLDVFVDVPFGLYLLITNTSKSTVPVLCKTLYLTIVQPLIFKIGIIPTIELDTTDILKFTVFRMITMFTRRPSFTATLSYQWYPMIHIIYIR